MIPSPVSTCRMHGCVIMIMSYLNGDTLSRLLTPNKRVCTNSLITCYVALLLKSSKPGLSCIKSPAQAQFKPGTWAGLGSNGPGLGRLWALGLAQHITPGASDLVTKVRMGSIDPMNGSGLAQGRSDWPPLYLTPIADVTAATLCHRQVAVSMLNVRSGDGPASLSKRSRASSSLELLRLRI